MWNWKSKNGPVGSTCSHRVLFFWLLTTTLAFLFSIPTRGIAQRHGHTPSIDIKKAIVHDSLIPIDTLTPHLLPVTITAFQGRGDGSDIAASIFSLDRSTLQLLDNSSLLSALNTAPGVRLEQRSPGSLRLSIRGSLLRSPYGIRGVKFYLDGMPLTDAGGNTYLQSLLPDQLSSAEIIKGPAGSLYGAGTGGAVLLHSLDTYTDSTINKYHFSYTGGSYGRIHPVAGWTHFGKKGFSQVGGNFFHSNGARDQDTLNQTVIHYSGRYRLSSKTEVRVSSFYSNLHYQTPGGITKGQWESDTTAYALAVRQKAAIFNKTLWTGLQLKTALGSRLQNETGVVFSYTDFKNPFTSNYEKRKELNDGARTVFSWQDHLNSTLLSWQLLAGMEWMSGHYHIDNYANRSGIPDTLQYKDRLTIENYTYFIQYQMSLFQKWHLQAGISTNRQHINYQRLSDPDFNSMQSASTKYQWSPKLGLTYEWQPGVALFASLAKGFSTPTIAELHPSDGRFEKALQPESGWNLEGGIKGIIPGTKLAISGSIYHFTLKNAIVRRVDAQSSEYFVNAGSTRQAGAELFIKTPLLSETSSKSHSLIHQITISGSYSYQPYRFLNYQQEDQNYQGHPLTGVPQNIAVVSVELTAHNGIYLNTLINATSSIPLNDASTIYQDGYQLWQAKMGYRFSWQSLTVDLYSGLDNILNQHYSLGNDINAYGGRYFNPAPKRNYYAGLSIWF
ncbi:iron complex outermembrane recepter protein [Arachidicoccus rhizosphaerae]|uniref:Iron complex outermembrane recepter protein n=2 Tax=Arachidicoccus rhizosphaerae TaxID=551991 RepID=A0A1H3WLG3_9BACT|nr:iron complex outermembrane recepter protein [Arachidicoccus rhizosphaerae]